LAETPTGVPISAIIFGGRRAELAPLVFEANDWRHGVLLGASMASETTAAATGAVGVVRRDPMAMKPFCGYNFADYWGHWLSFAEKSNQLPKIFHVNWFRQDTNGKFMWPGFGENLRVLKWILGRCDGNVEADSTPIGKLPRAQDIDLDGLDIGPEVVQALLEVVPEMWQQEFVHIREYFEQFGTRMPQPLWSEFERVSKSLGNHARTPVTVDD
jgi:phosphoenolpyruvate carboxykinase (GTP)